MCFLRRWEFNIFIIPDQKYFFVNNFWVWFSDSIWNFEQRRKKHRKYLWTICQKLRILQSLYCKEKVSFLYIIWVGIYMPTQNLREKFRARNQKNIINISQLSVKSSKSYSLFIAKKKFLFLYIIWVGIYIQLRFHRMQHKK